jgi:phage baseplate assembly protein V
VNGEIYERLLGAGGTGGLFHGVAIGIVSNNKDPDGLGRLKAKLPWLSEEHETDWIRMAVPMAGAQRGFWFLPEVDDEVLIAFQHGSPQAPVVIGALWNGKDKPPGNNSDGKNNVRSLTSRSGHVVRLTDTKGEEKVEIVDKSGKNSIVVDTAKNTITITADADLVLESKQGKVVLRGQGVEIDSTADVKIQAKAAGELKVGGQLTVKGATVNIN